MASDVVCDSSSHKIDLCRVSIFLAIIATVAFRNWSVVVYSAQVFMILMILAKLTVKNPVLRSLPYILCFGAFATLCCVSVFWAVNPNRVIEASFGVVQFVILGSFISIYALMENDFRFLIDCLAWAGVALLVVLVLTTPLSVWREAAEAVDNASTDKNRIGATVGYHPNALGYACATCMSFWYYRLWSSRKPLNIIPILLLFLVILFTKSRLSIVIALSGIMLFSFLSARGLLRKMFVALMVLFIILGTLWTLLTVPELYDLIGFRFAGMLGITGSVDASTLTRENMIRIALELFAENPVLGVGFSNYAEYYYYDYSGWAATYAHSTYAELLADLGLLGTVAYYAVPFWSLLRTACRPVSGADRGVRNLLASLLLVQLVADYSSISYTNDYLHIIWSVAFAFAAVPSSCGMAGNLSTFVGLAASRRKEGLVINAPQTHGPRNY